MFQTALKLYERCASGDETHLCFPLDLSFTARDSEFSLVHTWRAGKRKQFLTMYYVHSLYKSSIATGFSRNDFESSSYARCSHKFSRHFWSLLKTSLILLFTTLALQNFAYAANTSGASTEPQDVIIIKGELGYIGQELRGARVTLAKLNRLKTELLKIHPSQYSGSLNTNKWKEAKNLAENIKATDSQDQTQRDKVRRTIWDAISQMLGNIKSVKNSFEEIALRTKEGSLERTLLAVIWNKHNETIRKSTNSLFSKQKAWRNVFDRDFDRNDYRFQETSFSELLSLLNTDPKTIEAQIKEATENPLGQLKKEIQQIIDAERERIEKNISTLKQEQLEKVKLLRGLEKTETERRAVIDQGLVYAVYGMIVVLVFLFLGLKIFSDEVAKELIHRRSLVEVIGMAFMLITIIILGTGEKLSREVLGTLLGTIAGYIFARSVQRGREEGNQ